MAPRGSLAGWNCLGVLRRPQSSYLLGLQSFQGSTLQRSASTLVILAGLERSSSKLTHTGLSTGILQKMQLASPTQGNQGRGHSRQRLLFLKPNAGRDIIHVSHILIISHFKKRDYKVREIGISACHIKQRMPTSENKEHIRWKREGVYLLSELLVLKYLRALHFFSFSFLALSTVRRLEITKQYNSG